MYLVKYPAFEKLLVAYPDFHGGVWGAVFVKPLIHQRNVNASSGLARTHVELEERRKEKKRRLNQFNIFEINVTKRKIYQISKTKTDYNQ